LEYRRGTLVPGERATARGADYSVSER